MSDAANWPRPPRLPHRPLPPHCRPWSVALSWVKGCGVPLRPPFATPFHCVQWMRQRDVGEGRAPGQDRWTCVERSSSQVRSRHRPRLHLQSPSTFKRGLGVVSSASKPQRHSVDTHTQELHPSLCSLQTTNRQGGKPEHCHTARQCRHVNALRTTVDVCTVRVTL